MGPFVLRFSRKVERKGGRGREEGRERKGRREGRLAILASLWTGGN